MNLGPVIYTEVLPEAPSVKGAHDKWTVYFPSVTINHRVELLQIFEDTQNADILIPYKTWDLDFGTPAGKSEWIEGPGRDKIVTRHDRRRVPLASLRAVPESPPTPTQGTLI